MKIFGNNGAKFIEISTILIENKTHKFFEQNKRQNGKELQSCGLKRIYYDHMIDMEEGRADPSLGKTK